MAEACGTKPFVEVKTGRIFRSLSAAAREFGVTPTAILNSIKRRIRFRRVE